MKALLVANIIFSNPALWLGAGGVGVPVVIHLLTRRTTRKIIFPTVQFILRARASQSRLFRLRHLILLIVRTLLILLVLLAFLKPLLYSGITPRAQKTELRKAAVILLDVSASMGSSSGGVTPMSRAKIAAEKVLSQLHETDYANLILMGFTPKLSFGEPSNNYFHLRFDIKNASLTQERPDIDGAIKEALEQLEKFSGAKKEIYFISDFQRSNWAGVQFGVMPGSIQPYFISVGDDTSDNCAITEVSLQPALPTVSEPIQVIAKVSNFGDEPRQMPVQLKISDETKLRKDINIAPHMTRSVSFRIRSRKSGQYECVVSIPEDSLEVDNRRFLTIPVADQIHVLIVSDEDRNDSRAGHRFLMRAINPFSETHRGRASATLINSADLNLPVINKHQLIIFSGVNELPLQTVKHLIDYVRGGGSLVYFHVGGAPAHNLKNFVEASQGDFVMPFKLTGQIDHGYQVKFAALTEANFDHALLRKFKESQDLGNLQFYQYFSTERVRQKGKILLRYDDQNIAMAHKTMGIGSILLCNFSCSLHHSDFAKHTLFVPFIHEIINHLRPQTAGANEYEVGAACSATVRGIAANEPVEFRDPSDRKIDASMEIGQDESVIFFPRSKESGFYRIFVNEQTRGSVAVNVNFLESNPAILTEAQLQELSRLSQSRFLAASGKDQGAIERLLRGKPLWYYCIMGALFLFGVELILIRMWKK